MQLRPTTSAPPSARRLHASATVQFSRVTSAWCIASVMTATCPRCLDDVERNQRFLRIAERLADDEVHAGVHRPADLLLEHRAHRLVRSGVGRVVDVRVADVAGEAARRFRARPPCELERAAVDRLEILLATDDAQLLAMRVVGERLDDVGSGVHEVAMKLRHRFRMLEHDLRARTRRPADSRAARARRRTLPHRSRDPRRGALAVSSWTQWMSSCSALGGNRRRDYRTFVRMRRAEMRHGLHALRHTRVDGPLVTSSIPPPDRCPAEATGCRIWNIRSAAERLCCAWGEDS